jgi:hypothetical protein
MNNKNKPAGRVVRTWRCYPRREVMEKTVFLSTPEISSESSDFDLGMTLCSNQKSETFLQLVAILFSPEKKIVSDFL